MLLTSKIHTAKQKQLMGGCVTLRRSAIGRRWNVSPSAPALLLVELPKASDSFDRAAVSQRRAAYFGEKTVDWPIIRSVSSRGIVLMISLDKIRIKVFFFFCFFLPLLPVSAVTHQQAWDRDVHLFTKTISYYSPIFEAILLSLSLPACNTV